MLKFLLHLGRKAQLLQRDEHTALIEDTQYCFLSPKSGQSRDAQVNGAVIDDGIEPPSLREAGLGDIFPSQNLDAGEDIAMHIFAQAGGGHKLAVHPIAHLHPISPRLNVDIGGPHVHCIANNSPHHPHHGGIVEHAHHLSVHPSGCFRVGDRS